MNQPRHFVKLALLSLTLALTGCGSLTTEVDAPPPAPAAGTARIVFALNQGYPPGEAFIVEKTKLLGYVENNQHFVVDVPPGEHMFMLLSSNQDEAIAGTFEAGKNYHIKLFSTPGVWGTRVHAAPLEAKGEDLAERKEGVEETDRVELVPEKAKEWEADEREDLERRHKSFVSGEEEIGVRVGPEHAL